MGDSLSDLGELGGNLSLFVFRVFSLFVFWVCCFSSAGDSLSDRGELGGKLFLCVFRVFSFFVFCFFVFLVWGIP